MAITKSAKKRIRSTEKKTVFNLRKMRAMKAEITSFLKDIKEKRVEEAEKKLSGVYKAIDKASQRGVIKKNNAARKKSRLTKKVVDLKK